MLSFLSRLFDTSDFPPRWHCGNWTSSLGWLHIASDVAIFGAYFAIPVVLTYFVLRRKDVPFPPIFWLFAAFILCCGIGHAVEATLFWTPWYRLSGLVKLVTAVVSWTTVIALVPLLPKALALPGLGIINEQLRLTEERFRTTVEAAPTAMVMIDRGGKILLVNAQTEALFGYRRDELMGKPVELLVPQRLREQHPGLRDGFFANPVARRMGAGRELFGQRKDGSEFPVEIGLNPIQTPEGLCVLSAVVDITERKRAEEQIRNTAADLKRSNEELDRFAYSASHDLKAPLRAIQNLAQWISEDAGHLLPEQPRADLTLMCQRVARMDRLLNDLLEYSRVGRMTHKLETVDTGGLVRDVISLLVPPPGFRFSLDELPTLTTHKAPLEQVFRNLIGNAIKHHDRPDGQVRIAATDQGRFVEFTVQDDGPGIATEFHSQIFQMFQTLRPRDEVEGSGMGLALIQKIVESRYGLISLESAPGRGAKFRFTWPKDGVTSKPSL